METTAPAPMHFRTTHFINGQWSAAGGRTFPDYNPFNGAVVAEIASGGRAEALEAVAAADAAFPTWADMAPGVRQRFFLKAADVIERRTKGHSKHHGG